MLKNKKINKMLVGIIATGIVGASSTAYFYSESLKAEAQTEQVEDRATKLESTLSKKVESETKKSTELKKTIDNKNKEVTSLKKKLEQSKSAEQEEIKAREIAAQQIQEKQLEESTPVEQTSVGYVAEQAPVQQSQSSDQSYTGNSSSAKEWIAQKESNGSYSASNGYHVGRYQLDPKYLNGDHSVANQERVADQYVADRYGSWENAKSFWLSNGWY